MLPQNPLSSGRPSPFLSEIHPMSHSVADFRSDTITQPTEAMREAMARAEVGDDVLGDDPTVQRLQETVAELFGLEAALFVPSGTMANLVALRTHTEPGDEFVAEGRSHVFLYEGGGYAAVAGVSLHRLESERGLLDPHAIEAAIRPGGDSHFPRTRLIWLENTHNRAGGTLYPVEQLEAIGGLARARGLRLHIDGARCLNAAVALGVEPAEIARYCDSISVCLSKGLGCPAGSLLLGPRDFIDRAHRFRKMFGGGMRQSGVLAAAGLHALEHHVHRLADDHARAHTLAEAWARLPGVRTESPSTNLIYVDVRDTGRSAVDLQTDLETLGVRVLATGEESFRAVTHLDVGDSDVERAIAALGRVLPA